MRTLRLTPVLLVLALLPGLAAAADRACEQSESTVTAAPGGKHAASVQHQVCETAAGGVAAAVTVFVGDSTAPLRGARVVAVAVPRSREEWPRAVWRGESTLEVWVPNLAQVLETKSAHDDIVVSLKYCGDDPAARASIVQHEADMQQWMRAVSRWAELRNTDPEAAGARPPRPEEPRLTPRACRDSDIAP